METNRSDHRGKSQNCWVGSSRMPRGIPRCYTRIEHMHVCVPSFSEDPDVLGQWRAYGGASGRYAPGFVFREGRSMPVPYAKLKLTGGPNVYFSSVTVGPAPHMSLSIGSTAMLLRRNHVNDAESKVTGSKIPYRNWVGWGLYLLECLSKEKAWRRASSSAIRSFADSSPMRRMISSFANTVSL